MPLSVYYFWQPTSGENLGRLIKVRAASPNDAKQKLAQSWSGEKLLMTSEAEDLLAQWSVVGPIEPEEIA